MTKFLLATINFISASIVKSMKLLNFKLKSTITRLGVGVLKARQTGRNQQGVSAMFSFFLSTNLSYYVSNVLGKTNKKSPFSKSSYERH